MSRFYRRPGVQTSGLSLKRNKFSEAYRTYAVGLLVFMLSFVFSAMINTPEATHADEQIHADVTATPYSIAIASVGEDGDEVNITVNAVGSGTEVIGKDTVRVTTNAPMYRLYVQTTTTGGKLVNATAGSWISPSTGTSSTLAALSSNTWGYGIHRNTTTGVGKGTAFPTTETYTEGEQSTVGTLTYAQIPTTSPGDLLWESETAAPSGAQMDVFTRCRQIRA